jgi:predicted DNA-binding protein (MmcQ/YjbR family)
MPPSAALQYRAEYPAVQAGYHLNKQHWNTVLLDGSIPEAMVRQMVDHSYELVLAGLSKAEREEIGGGGEGGRLVEV